MPFPHAAVTGMPHASDGEEEPIMHFQELIPFFKGRLPGQLVIQYASHCNADCPQCGMRRSNNFERTRLDKDTVKRLIDDAAQKGVQALSFTGGEPLLFLEDIVELINHATSAGIKYVRTGTNGFLFMGSERPDFEARMAALAARLAETSLYTFWISIDSADPREHEQMRGLPGVICGIEKALPIFHARGIFPSVNLGINRNTGGKNPRLLTQGLEQEEFSALFREAFNRFYTFVHGLGFTIVNACYPMSDNPDQKRETSEEGNGLAKVYGASSSDRVISFTAEEKGWLFQALFDTIPLFRGKMRIFSPRSSLYSLVRKFRENTVPLYPCRGGHDFFFVESSKAHIHPCGYLPNVFPELPDLRNRRTHDVKSADCHLCEWECFRDPSEMLGPFAELCSHPLRLAGKLIRDPAFFRILLEDIRYYRSCGFFNCRQPPNLAAMSRFARGVRP
jgi:MoaA/NifB/PqqE/SkfB family radical SAM enzyme